MNGVFVNYEYDPTWLKEYTWDSLAIYDRSDSVLDATKYTEATIYKTKNLGDVDYDKLSYLVENYDNLPETFIWGKTNLFKFIEQEEFNKVKDNTTFTPLLTKNHKTYSDRFGVVCAYQGEIYCERADSWYFHADGVTSKHFHNWESWALHFGLPITQYVPFAPGGNYILTKEKVHKYSRDYYDEMRSFLPHSQRPAEAHAAERSYYLMWK